MFALIALPSFGCSIAYKSFCETAAHYQSGNILQAKIIDTIPHGIRLQVIDVIRGTENRDTVIVWDGTDIDCNGPFPMNAWYMGMPGDTILAVMTAVDTLAQPWQVLGDYVRTNNFGHTPELKIQADTLQGFISGYVFAPNQFQLWEYAFTDWLNYWTTHNNNCNTLMDIENTSEDAVVVYPNPANDQLQITGLHDGDVAHIFSSEKLLADVPVTGGTIDISQLSSGVYILRMEDKGMPVTRRFVKL